MTYHSLLAIAILLPVLAGFGCSTGRLEVTTPQGKTVRYPSVITDDGRRRQAVVENWTALLAERKLPPAEAEFEPVTYSIRALPARIAGAIRITEKEVNLSPIEAREALRKFIDRHSILLFGEAGLGDTAHQILSLTAFSEDGKFYRATWRQTNYPYEIENGYGRLQIAISRQGALLQLSSRLIPAVSLPASPEVANRDLIDRMVGRTFGYSDIAGRNQTYRVPSTDAVRVHNPVIYPVQEGDTISIRLAVPVEVGSGMTWTVFIDAVDGRELAVRQNFQT